MKIPVHVRIARSAVQAYCPELPGCSASGRTEQEALALLRLRIESHFAASARSTLPGARVVQIEV